MDVVGRSVRRLPVSGGLTLLVATLAAAPAFGQSVGAAALTTGGEVRLRYEGLQNNLWGDSPAPDDGYLWGRVMPYADLRVGPARVFVQPIAAYAVGVAPAASPIDETRIDVLQAFGEVTLPAGLRSFKVRAGRQMAPLGAERLVGRRYGPNLPLSFDGIRADVASGRGTLSILRLKPVQAGPRSFDDRSSVTKSLWGAYAATPNLDLYYLGYRNRAATFGGLVGHERRESFGVRSFGDHGPWRWNLEAVVQGGRFGDHAIQAWTASSEVVRQFPNVGLSPVGTIRVNVVSGDRNPGDGKLETFNALFPKGKYFGELSPIGPYNIVSINPGVTLAVAPDLTVGLSAMGYWRYATADGIYDVPGSLLRAPGGSTARFVGKQVEVSLEWSATSHLNLSASLSAFAPGAFVRQTGPAKTIGMVGAEANYQF